MQATPARLLKALVLGLRSSRHRLPSNDSATVDTTWPLECWPTAMQNDSETQETPARLVELAWLGLRIVDQAWPRQTWMDVCGVPPRVVPTATQKLSDVQETPESTFVSAGLLLGVTRQERPFHTSIRPWLPPRVK